MPEPDLHPYYARRREDRIVDLVLWTVLLAVVFSLIALAFSFRVKEKPKSAEQIISEIEANTEKLIHPDLEARFYPNGAALVTPRNNRTVHVTMSVYQYPVEDTRPLAERLVSRINEQFVEQFEHHADPGTFAQLGPPTRFCGGDYRLDVSDSYKPTTRLTRRYHRPIPCPGGSR